MPSFGSPFCSVALWVPHCCPRFWRVLFCGTLTDEEVGLVPFSSRPVAVSPPFWGWVCFGGLTGVVVHLRDAWRGFSSLGWLAGCSPGSLSFYFRAACFYAGCLGFYASFPPGEGSWFLRLAWRYGCRFWRRPFPYPWCFPGAGGTVSVSTF